MHVPPTSTIYALTLWGRQVSKKNLLRPRRGGGYYYDKETRALIDAYVWQAQAQWRDHAGKRPPLNRFRHTMALYNQRADPDGIETTTLDCLVTAGVLTDDAAKHALGGTPPVSFRDSKEPRVVVTLEAVAPSQEKAS